MSAEPLSVMVNVPTAIQDTLTLACQATGQTVEQFALEAVSERCKELRAVVRKFSMTKRNYNVPVKMLSFARMALMNRAHKLGVKKRGEDWDFEPVSGDCYFLGDVLILAKGEKILGRCFTFDSGKISLYSAHFEGDLPK